MHAHKKLKNTHTHTQKKKTFLAGKPGSQPGLQKNKTNKQVNASLQLALKREEKENVADFQFTSTERVNRWVCAVFANTSRFVSAILKESGTVLWVTYLTRSSRGIVTSISLPAPDRW